MTAKVDTHPQGRDGNRLGSWVARCRRQAAFALTFFKPHPGKALSSHYHRTRKQLIRDTVDRMRADMGMEPIKWPRMRF